MQPEVPPIPVNPEAIGDPDQTPIVYIGDLADLLGIPDRSATHSGELSQTSNEGDNHG